MSVEPGLISLYDNYGGNINLESNGGYVSLSTTNNTDITVSHSGVSLVTNGLPISLDPGMAAAVYKGSEIATMDNLIGSGSVLPDASEEHAPKFFVLI